MIKLNRLIIIILAMLFLAGCRSVDDMKEKNKKETQSSRDELVEDGYSPCGNCKP